MSEKPPSPPGSSPHTRGALACGQGMSNRTGIIPAYAGSTRADRFDGDGLRGSSPHTRGALPLSRKRRSAIRIIPAYAGSTSTARAVFRVKRDHPRIRGEHVVPLVCDATREGSSPHTRGARLSSSMPTVYPGIIPAYAGSTRRHHAMMGASSDHPRIRGEHP